MSRAERIAQLVKYFGWSQEDAEARISELASKGMSRAEAFPGNNHPVALHRGRCPVTWRGLRCQFLLTDPEQGREHPDYHVFFRPDRIGARERVRLTDEQIAADSLDFLCPMTYCGTPTEPHVAGPYCHLRKPS